MLGLNRSSFYYEPAKQSPENLQLMRRIDEQYLKTPFFGSRRMAIVLAREGEEVNRKRVKRLMGLMGLEAIHPGPRTTVPNPDHSKDSVNPSGSLAFPLVGDYNRRHGC